jgi:D,D-heptose 1,7-bisphosphate phosphatase
MNKAIFLDRDGTINVDHGYVYNPDDLHFIDGVEDALLTLQKAGFLLIIITNQSGIGRGYFNEQQATNFNQYLTQQLQKIHIKIQDTFMCVHAPEDKCQCRKPSPFLVIKAIQKYNIDPKQSFMLGDKQSDVECGLNAGVHSFLIDNEHSMKYWTNKILNKKTK